MLTVRALRFIGPLVIVQLPDGQAVGIDRRHLQAASESNPSSPVSSGEANSEASGKAKKGK